MATQDDLVKRVLSLEKVIQAGQTPDAVSAALVTSIIPSVVDELATNGVAYIPVDATTPFPDKYLQWLAVLIAEYVSADFGDGADPAVIEYAKRNLRKLNDTRAAPSEVVRAEFY